MTELVNYIVKAIVDYPEDVSVKEVDKKEVLLLELMVHPDDVGKVIGKNGRMIKAIRSIVSTKAATLQKQVRLEIIEQ